MQEFEIERDNDTALSFTGELIAKVSSSGNNASGSSYLGQTGRWQGERNSHHAKACTDYKQVIDFFGHGWPAKDLYDEAGINANEVIE